MAPGHKVDPTQPADWLPWISCSVIKSSWLQVTEKLAKASSTDKFIYYHRTRTPDVGHSKINLFSGTVQSGFWVSVVLLTFPSRKKDLSSKKNLSLHPADFLTPLIGLCHCIFVPKPNTSEGTRITTISFEV